MQAKRPDTREGIYGDVSGTPRILRNFCVHPAYLQETRDGLCLQFTGRSSFPEVRLHLAGPPVYQLALPFERPLTSEAHRTICPPVAQTLR